jgi:hypothetical protein
MRIEWLGFLLRDHNQTVQFRHPGLLNRVSFSIPRMRTASNSRSTPTASALEVYSGALEADADMTLRGEIVDLGRPDLLHQPDRVGRIRDVAIVQEKRHIAGVVVFIEIIDARGIERGRPSLDAVHGVAEAKQVFGEIGVGLAGNAN